MTNPWSLRCRHPSLPAPPGATAPALPPGASTRRGCTRPDTRSTVTTGRWMGLGSKRLRLISHWASWRSLQPSPSRALSAVSTTAGRWTGPCTMTEMRLPGQLRPLPVPAPPPPPPPHTPAQIHADRSKRPPRTHAFPQAHNHSSAQALASSRIWTGNDSISDILLSLGKALGWAATVAPSSRAIPPPGPGRRQCASGPASSSSSVGVSPIPHVCASGGHKMTQAPHTNAAHSLRSAQQVLRV